MDKPILDRIKQRIRQHGENYKINELCMDQLPIEQFTPDITKLLQKCLNVQYITFQNCGIKSLENIPRYPKLQTLQLGSNKITGETLNQLIKYNNLTTLSLQNNLISNIQDLRPLQSCRQLTKLMISGNSACTQNYRGLLFLLLPQVEIIDGQNKAGQNVKQESSSEGQSEYSDEDIQQSQNQDQRDSPTKNKRKN